MSSTVMGVVVMGIGIALAGCTPKEEAATQQKPSPPAAAHAAEVPPASGDATAEAAQIFEQRCAVCHGMSGDGDGTGSAALSPKPRKLTDPEWQKSVTDDYLAKIIVYGGAAVGKSPTMPGNPDLDAKPAVVNAIVAYVRDLNQ